MQRNFKLYKKWKIKEYMVLLPRIPSLKMIFTFLLNIYSHSPQDPQILAFFIKINLNSNYLRIFILTYSNAK